MAAESYGPTGGYDSEFTAGRGGDRDTIAADASARARDALDDETAQEQTLRLEQPLTTTAEDRAIAFGDAANRDNRDNSGSSGEEISGEVIRAREEVEETRAELSDTIEAIKEKLSPQNLMAEAKESAVEKAHDALDSMKEAASNVASSVASTAQDALGSAVETAKSVASNVKDSASHAMDSISPTLRSAGETAKGAGATIVETIRLNPIPAAITGIGLGWLIMSIRRQSESNASSYDSMTPATYSADRFASTTDEFGSQGSGGMNNYATAASLSDQPSAMDNVKDRLGDAKDKVAQTASNVGQSVSDAAHNVASSASDMAHNMGDKASALGSQAKEYGQRAAGATSDYFQASPLAVGAIALLAGAAIGLMLPSTEPENRWMGETRDRLKDQATQQIQQVADKVQNVASAAFDQAKTTVTQTVQQEAQNQGLTTAGV